MVIVQARMMRVDASDTVISINPKSYEAQDKGEVFTIDVTVTNVGDLYAYQFDLFYDTALLDGVDVTFPPGHFLTPADPEKFLPVKQEVTDDYNATHGRVLVAALLLAPEPAKNGSGILSRLKFKVTGTGSCTLDLSGTKLGSNVLDPYTGLPLKISHETIGGTFKTLGQPVAPFPVATVAIVIVVAIVLFAAFLWVVRRRR